MSTPRRIEGPGFGHQGGSNLADYLGATGRVKQIELEMEPGERLVEIPVDLIDRSPFQARTNFDPEEIAALGEDIREHGLNHPVTVRETSGGRYELVAGERRWLAAKDVGESHVIARVRLLDDFAAHLVGVSENNRRADLSPWEMSLEAARLLDHAVEASRPHTQRDLARYLNRNVSLINQQLAIAEALSRVFLQRAQVAEADVCRLPHVTLRRICKLTEAQRSRAIGEAIRAAQGREQKGPANGKPSDSQMDAVESVHRGNTWLRLWELGGFEMRLPKAFREIAPDEAERHADEIALVLGGLATRASEGVNGRSTFHWEHPQGRLVFVRDPDELPEPARSATRELMVKLSAIFEWETE